MDIRPDEHLKIYTTLKYVKKNGSIIYSIFARIIFRFGGVCALYEYVSIRFAMHFETARINFVENYVEPVCISCIFNEWKMMAKWGENVDFYQFVTFFYFYDFFFSRNKFVFVSHNEYKNAFFAIIYGIYSYGFLWCKVWGSVWGSWHFKLFEKEIF